MIFLSIWLVRRTSSDAKILKVNGLAFSTLYEVKVVTSKVAPGADDALKTAIKREVDLVDKAMSRFREDSEIARFNILKGMEPFEVSKATASLLKKSGTRSIRSWRQPSPTILTDSGPMIGISTPSS